MSVSNEYGQFFYSTGYARENKRISYNDETSYVRFYTSERNQFNYILSTL